MNTVQAVETHGLVRAQPQQGLGSPCEASTRCTSAKDRTHARSSAGVSNVSLPMPQTIPTTAVGGQRLQQARSMGSILGRSAKADEVSDRTVELPADAH